jgi:hypothetical protein
MDGKGGDSKGCDSKGSGNSSGKGRDMTGGDNDEGCDNKGSGNSSGKGRDMHGKGGDSTGGDNKGCGNSSGNGEGFSDTNGTGDNGDFTDIGSGGRGLVMIPPSWATSLGFTAVELPAIMSGRQHTTIARAHQQTRSDIKKHYTQSCPGQSGFKMFRCS